MRRYLVTFATDRALLPKVNQALVHGVEIKAEAASIEAGCLCFHISLTLSQAFGAGTWRTVRELGDSENVPEPPRENSKR